MRLVRQTKLSFKQGTSDKVYEVDLCEAAEGEFIVNFRYGRRGNRLTEGTKTPFPESQVKAENIFSKLVAGKVAKGYQVAEHSGIPTENTTQDTPPAPTANADDPRIPAVLARLRKGVAKDPWKLSRAIWLTGQWRLTEAAPLLRTLATDASGMDAWCLAWALGRCGSNEDIPLLDALISRNNGNEAIHRIAREAKLTLLDPSAKEAFIQNVIATLPTSFSDSLKQENASDLTQKLKESIESGKAPPNLSADLFLISPQYPHAREALYNVAQSINTRENGMLLLRQLFKAAEFRIDAEIYGCIAKRFESDTNNGSGYYDYKTRSWINSPFSSATKKYFKKRIWRHLKRAGDEGDAATFIPLSTGILLAYDDALDNLRESTFQTYGSDPTTGEWGPITTHLLPRSSSHSFHWLLRGNSSALKRNQRSLAWSFLEEPTTPQGREEIYSELWDVAPDAIRHLLAQSRAAEVQDFAMRIWKDHKEWEDDVDLPFVISILSSWYAPTASLGLALAERLWNPQAPQEDLLLAMIESHSESAQQVGGRWLKEIQAQLNSLPNLVIRLAFVKSENGQHAVREGLSGIILSSEVQKQVIAKVISGLISLSDDTDDAHCARFAIEILRLIAAPELVHLPQSHIAELAAHPLEALQIFAARILIEQNKAAELPETLLLAPLSSDFPTVRQLGLTLLDTLPEDTLASRTDTLASCAISPHQDLRENVRPLIAKIAPKNPEFCKGLVEKFYPLLLRKESHEGLHIDVYELLSGALGEHLDTIPLGLFPRMLKSEYPCAQALGFLLLKRETNLKETPLTTLIEWANHPHAELRNHVWSHFEATPEALISNLGVAPSLLESDWQDTQSRASTFFRDTVEESAWEPDSLIAICDSTRGEIQDFGREMITRRFREEDGPLYLAHLSQHPSTELQIFASNYLMRFATDQPEKISLLEPYFRTVLTKIGAGRTAKQRIFTLLEQESIKDLPTAELVVSLLNRISATIAIGDKSTCITILSHIAERWPELQSPLQFTTPALREPELA